MCDSSSLRRFIFGGRRKVLTTVMPSWPFLWGNCLFIVQSHLRLYHLCHCHVLQSEWTRKGNQSQTALWLRKQPNWRDEKTAQRRTKKARQIFITLMLHFNLFQFTIFSICVLIMWAGILDFPKSHDRLMTFLDLTTLKEKPVKTRWEILIDRL